MTFLPKILLLGCLAAFEISCAPLPPQKTETEAQVSESSFASSSTNPQILVTFEDERKDRFPLGDTAGGYRQRDTYYNSTWSKRVAEALAEEYGIRQVTQWPINSLGIHCVVYEIPANRPVEEVLKTLAKDKRVEAVQPMKKFHVTGDAAYSDPYFKLQSGVREMHIASAHRIATGQNVKIAVIDTGVDDKHPDLAGQIAFEQNFVDKKAETPDDIHGTAVAGIIVASSNNQQGIVGVAPNAKIIALKACWQVGAQKADADCDSLTLALALNAAILLKPNIINLSLIGPKDPLVERLVSKALDEGIIVVASTNANASTGKDFPASVNRVIAVQTAHLNSENHSIDIKIIAAPGQEILTTLPHSTYNFMSGSSFAAAHVSGLIALMLELKPSLDSAQILTMLQAYTTHSTNASAFNTVNACSALASISGVQTCESTKAKYDQALQKSPSSL